VVIRAELRRVDRSGGRLQRLAAEGPGAALVAGTIRR
jgi:hypothetical protein